MHAVDAHSLFVCVCCVLAAGHTLPSCGLRQVHNTGAARAEDEMSIVSSSARSLLLCCSCVFLCCSVISVLLLSVSVMVNTDASISRLAVVVPVHTVCHAVSSVHVSTCSYRKHTIKYPTQWCIRTDQPHANNTATAHNTQNMYIYRTPRQTRARVELIASYTPVVTCPMRGRDVRLTCTRATNE